MLVLSVFAGAEAAARVLRDLRGTPPVPVCLSSAATVSVCARGYALGTTTRPGTGRGFPGVFWEALFGLVFLVPVAGSSYGPSAGALFGALPDLGVDEAFLGEAREALCPGTSAIALLVAPEEQDALADLSSRGAVLVGTSLTADEDAALQRELGGPP